MYVQGNIIDPKTKRKVIGNTATTAVADVARNNQALSASLLDLIENNALGYPKFVTTSPYSTGEKVFHDRKLWNFIADKTTGAWDATKVEEFSIKDYLDAITVALEAKANTDGYYKNLVSGLSENLIDTKGQGSEQTFFKRTSCGDVSITDDGAAMVQKFLGNSVKFNQLCNNGNFATKSVWSLSRGDYSVSDNIASITVSSGANGTIYQAVLDNISGHKIYARAEMKGTGALELNSLDSTTGSNVNSTTTFVQLSVIKVSDESTMRMFLRNTDVNNPLYAKNVICLDLTAMGIDSFTTAAQVEAWLAANVGLKPYYGYTEGIVLNNKALGVRTIGFNRYNPSTGKAELVNYTNNGTNQYQITGTYSSVSFTDILGNTSVPVIDSNGYFSISQDGVLNVVGGNATDTCVHLCWSGYRDGEWEEYWEQSRTKDLTTVTGKKDGTGESVVIFPDGLCKIGDVSDEIQGNKAIKRFGKVDLGDLTWNTTSNAHRFFASTPYIKGVSTQDIVANIICSAYKTVSRTNIEVADKQVSCFSNTLNLYDESITVESGSAVAPLVTGVKLYYELATPEVYILDEDFNTSYKVADFGTEEMIPQELDANDLPQSAAFHAVIKYNDDFTRTIANIPKYVQPLLEAIAYLNGEVQGLKDSIKDYAMDMKANIMDVMEYYVYNVPKVLLSSATGAPSASNVPTNWDAQRSGTWDAVPRTEGLVYIDGAGDVWVSNGTASDGNWKKVS